MIVPDFRTIHAWVIGDVMLDVDQAGSIERTSPEAPVPIVRTGGRVTALGGAANVAANVAALGAQVTLFGVIGADSSGRSIADLAAERGIDARLVVDAGRPTTVKTRVYSHGKQVVRLDRESTEAILPSTEDELVGSFARSDRRPDVVIVSDYAKGVVTRRLVKSVTTLERRPIVVADPKRRDVDVYAGVDYITPNENEVERVIHTELGDTPDLDDVMPLLDVVDRGVLVTQGRKGMTLFRRTQPPLRIPSEARQVFDVTGAGDSVVATFALCLAAGVDEAAATVMANAAGGITVGRRGTAVVTRSDLAGVTATFATRRGKLLTWDEAAWLREANRLDGRRVVFTNGCFDLLHAGHVHLLVAARGLGDLLIVGLDDDESVRALKGASRPVIEAADRAAILSALEPVDAIVMFPDGRGTLLELVELLEPDVIVKGGDYRDEEIVGADVVRGAGGDVAVVPLLPLRSSSQIIDRFVGPVEEGRRP